VVVRTIDDTDLEKLRAAGATEVVPEAIEGSLMLASHALALVGVPMRRVLRIARDARDRRYGLLRGYFHGLDDDTGEDRDQARLQSIPLPAGSVLDGCKLGEVGAVAWGVSVISIKRSNGAVLAAADDVVLRGGDTLVISGTPEALARAEHGLLVG
jgi:CPA2 family monovalent cation:H+ antiporter-2